MNFLITIFLSYFVLVFLATGCATTQLPSSGPSRSEIKSSPSVTQSQLQFIKIDQSNVAQVGPRRVKTINTDFRTAFSGKNALLLGVGDRLLISIWEASGDGLFSTTEKKQTDIEATIDEKGKIFIPYVGLLDVAKKDIEAVRIEISRGLKGKALEPQVQVKLLDNVSNTVVAIGEVNSPGMYPIAVGGLRLLDILAKAGGSKSKAFESEISIVRDNKKAVIRLDEILANSDNDIWMKPGDTLQAVNSPRIFTALGAVRGQKKYNFETPTVTLSEGLAQAGGLIDEVSDSAGVFLFRYETVEFLRSIEPADLSRSAKKKWASYSEMSPNLRVPVIYQLDLSETESLFWATSFQLKDKDLIYVSTAPAREYNKFINTFVKPLLDVGRTGITISREFE